MALSLTRVVLPAKEPPEGPRGSSSYLGRARRVTFLGASCCSKHILGAVPKVWKAPVGQPAEAHRFGVFLKKVYLSFSSPLLCFVSISQV